MTSSSFQLIEMGQMVRTYVHKIASNEPPAKQLPQFDVEQKIAAIGDIIPIVFCRRNETAGTGGVLIAPAATEARFTNSSSTNAVTVYWHLVLSEGRIGSIQRRDVFWRGYRVGTYTQTYDRRAGSWTPGNAITDYSSFQYRHNCPKYCGSIGTYPSISTLSFNYTPPITNSGYSGTVDNATAKPDADWNRQVFCFIREGMYVTRLVDSVEGPSNNYADLIYWLYVNSSKLPGDQIDVASLTTAANFLDANGISCDVELTNPENLDEFISRSMPFFLLRESRVNGKRGLKPVVPIDPLYKISVRPISWKYLFTEEHIVLSSFEISYIPLANRLPFCVQVAWRQQPTDDFAIPRTTEIRYKGTAESGPYEQYDLSEFCTSEAHAIRFGSYILSRRRYVTHTVSVTLIAGNYSKDLDVGDIVRIYLTRSATGAQTSYHDHLYEVERIVKTLNGELMLELVHFPILRAANMSASQISSITSIIENIGDQFDDATNLDGRSMVAIDVATAVTESSNVTISFSKTGPTRDDYSSSDTSVPSEVYSTGTPLDTIVEFDAFNSDGDGDGMGVGESSEYIATIEDPSQYDRLMRVNDAGGDGIDYGNGITGSTTEVQSVIFDASRYNESTAQQWLADNGFIAKEFELVKSDDPFSNLAKDSIRRQDLPHIESSPDGPYIGSTLYLYAVECETLQVDWARDGVIQPAQRNKLGYYIENADAGHDITAIITCADGTTYTTEPVNAGTPYMPASFTGNVNMYLINTFVQCNNGQCIETEGSLLLGQFTAAQHRTFYYKSYHPLAGTQCGSPPGPGPCPPNNPDCGGYTGCPLDPYFIQVAWSAGIVGLLYPWSFPTVSPNSGSTPSRLIAIPV